MEYTSLSNLIVQTMWRSCPSQLQGKAASVLESSHHNPRSWQGGRGMEGLLNISPMLSWSSQTCQGKCVLIRIAIVKRKLLNLCRWMIGSQWTRPFAILNTIENVDDYTMFKVFNELHKSDSRATFIMLRPNRRGWMDLVSSLM